MTIRSTFTNPATEADAGKYAVRDTVFRNGFCSRPILITKVAKSRVYYRDTTRVWDNREFKTCHFAVDDHEDYMKADGLRYICDTLDEATLLHDLSEQQHRELTDTDKAVREKYKGIVEKLLT